MVTQEWETLEELQDCIELRSATPNSLYKKVKPYLDYNVMYAEDRVKQIKDNWDDELYADCISSPYFTNKQVKKQEDELSEEENTLTDHLDRIANYILYSSFDNEAERQRYEELKEQKREAKHIQDKNERIKKEVAIRDEQKTRPSLISSHRKTQTGYEVQLEGTLQQSNRHYEIQQDDSSRVFYSFKDKELNQNSVFKNNLRYWEHYGQHNNSTMDSIFDKVDHNLKYYKFAYEDLKMKEENIANISRKLEEHPLTTEAKAELYSILRENKQEYNFVAELLRDRVTLSSSIAKDVDPMQDIERRINYADEAILKELIYGFAELKEKYKYKTSSVLWGALIDIEKIVNQEDKNKQQQVIFDYIMKSPSWDYSEIICELERELGKSPKKSTISYHIDNLIKQISKTVYEKEVNK